MSKGRALVIEDDEDLQKLMGSVLTNSGFDVRAVATGAEALQEARDFGPDVITLDLNLPDTEGLILCRSLRTATDAYIIILSARSDTSQVLVGLDSGADDYMTKPFSSLELSARINALLRRPRGQLSSAAAGTIGTLIHGELVIETAQRTSRVNGVDLILTKVEYDLLTALAKRPEQLVTRKQLLAEVWGTSWSDQHLVDVHIANIRRKLRPISGNVEVVTVRGLGYRLHRRDE